MPITRSEIKAIVAEIIDKKAEDIGDKDDFENDLGIDSLDYYKILLDLEEKTGIEIDSCPFDFRTVDECIQFLKSKGKEIIEMNLQNINYVFTITGGGWSSCHKLYAVTKDRKILFTDKFDDIETAEPKYLFDLDDDLDFEAHDNSIGFDAPECTMYKTTNGKLKRLYSVGMYNNTPAVDTVCRLHYLFYR